jgi:flagellar motor switch protein FliN
MPPGWKETTMSDEFRAGEPAQPEGTQDRETAPDDARDAGPGATGEPPAEAPTVRPIEFDPLQRRAPGTERAGIDLLLDVKLPIAVELGRTEVEVKTILEFGPGSIIELDKLANEPVDLLVNGVLVARGEVVVVDDSFGIRLTALVSPAERIRILGRAA